MTGKSNRCAVWLVGLVSLALVIPMESFGLQEAEPYEVGIARPPVDPGRTLVDITLDEAIARALERNLDIQTARLSPQIQRIFTHMLTL